MLVESLFMSSNKKQKNASNPTCSTPFLFYLFPFYLLYNRKKTCFVYRLVTGLAYRWSFVDFDYFHCPLLDKSVYNKRLRIRMAEIIHVGGNVCKLWDKHSTDWLHTWGVVLHRSSSERESSRPSPHNRPAGSLTFACRYPSPLLTRLSAGKSLIFIQSVPLPFLHKAGCECRPSACYCVLILGSIICCNKCAVGRVTFTLILHAPKRSFPLAMDQRSRLL